jgi:hypothetical protein
MVIPQVFGSSSVLYRVAEPLFYNRLCVRALLSAGVRGDALHDRWIIMSLTAQRQHDWRLAGACAVAIAPIDVHPGAAIIL